MKIKYRFLLIISILITYQATAQQVHIDHSKLDTCLNLKYVIPTNDGSIFFVGSTTCTSISNIYIPAGITDTSVNVMIGKMDSNEHVQWVKVYGGSAVDSALSACQTSDGGYAILAYTNSADGDVTGARGNGDLWLIKVDSAGNMEWSKIFGTTQYDYATSVAATPDSGCIILGTTTGNDGDADIHYGNTDWLVVKIDASGHKQWSKVFGGGGYESNKGSILSANNGYYLASTTITSAAPILLFIDTAGSLIGNNSYVAPYNDVREIYDAIWDDRDSSIVMIGNQVYASSPGYSSIWIQKVNKNGGVVWTRNIWDTYGIEHGYSITKSLNNGYIGVGFCSLHYSMLGWPPAVNVNMDAGLIFMLDSMGNSTMGNSIYNSGFGCTTSLPYPKSIAQFNNSYVVIGSGKPTCSLLSQLSSSAPLFSGSSSGIKNNFFCFLGNVPLSVSNSSIPNKWKVYPNPIDNVLHIDNIKAPVNYSLLNILGATVLQGKLEYLDNSISTEQLASGTYLLQLTDAAGQREVVRVVKGF